MGEQVPLTGSTYPAGTPPAVAIVNEVLSTIKKPIYLLDITTLSQLRKDAHPSTYSGEHSGTDCSHWCLPGLPDTWNQLLYAALIMWSWRLARSESIVSLLYSISCPLIVVRVDNKIGQKSLEKSLSFLRCHSFALIIGKNIGNDSSKCLCHCSWRYVVDLVNSYCRFY